MHERPRIMVKVSRITMSRSVRTVMRSVLLDMVVGFGDFDGRSVLMVELQLTGILKL